MLILSTHKGIEGWVRSKYWTWDLSREGPLLYQLSYLGRSIDFSPLANDNIEMCNTRKATGRKKETWFKKSQWTPIPNYTINKTDPQRSYDRI